MKENDRLKEDLKELFRTQSLAVLATQSDHGSYASLVAFLATEDLKHLLFATNRATRKYANLSSNSHVAMLVDNRSNRASDFRKALAVTATGDAEELREHQKEEYVERYLVKHPFLREFVTAPSCALLRIRVDTYYVVSRFQNVMELHVNP